MRIAQCGPNFPKSEKSPSYEKKIQIYFYKAGTTLNYKFDIYFID